MPYLPAHLVRQWSTTLERRLLAPAVAVNGAGESLVVAAVEDGHFSAHNALARLTTDGKVVWTKHVAGSDGENMHAALDASGDAIIVGGFRTQIDFGRALQGDEGLHAYAVKLDFSGHVAWAARFGDAGVQHADAVAVDGEGNAVIAGTFEGTIDFGVGALRAVGQTDVFVAMLGRTGDALWSRRLGGQGVATAITTDRRGNVTIAVEHAAVGRGRSLVDVYGLNRVGKPIWSRSLDVVRADHIATDGDGNVFVMADVGRGCVVTNSSPPSTKDTALVKLDDRGRRLWTRRLGKHQDWRSLAVDARRVVVPVADTTGSWSLMFIDAAGRIEGRAPLQTLRVGGIAIDGGGAIVLAEQGVVDDPNRVFVESWRGRTDAPW